eukprot:872608-Rhodomonas_salina.2
MRASLVAAVVPSQTRSELENAQRKRWKVPGDVLPGVRVVATDGLVAHTALEGHLRITARRELSTGEMRPNRTS